MQSGMIYTCMYLFTVTCTCVCLHLHDCVCLHHSTRAVNLISNCVSCSQKLNIAVGRYRRGFEWDVVHDFQRYHSSGQGQTLGKGGMGSCVLAWDVVSQRRFCAKEVCVGVR